MTTFKENIIKLTDYPFSYSLIALLTLIVTSSKFVIPRDFPFLWPFIVIIGISGTLLSIIDPLGKLIRFWLNPYKQHLDAKEKAAREDYMTNKKGGTQKWRETESKSKVINTNWISYEIDKNVSSIYFSIIVVLIIFIFNDAKLYSSFVNLIESEEPETSTDINNAKIFYSHLRLPLLIGFIILNVILVPIILYSIYKLKSKVEVIIKYFNIIDDIERYKKTPQYNLLEEHIKNFQTYLNDRDWALAELIIHRIRHVKRNNEV